MTLFYTQALSLYFTLSPCFVEGLAFIHELHDMHDFHARMAYATPPAILVIYFAHGEIYFSTPCRAYIYTTPMRAAWMMNIIYF